MAADSSYPAGAPVHPLQPNTQSTLRISEILSDPGMPRSPLSECQFRAKTTDARGTGHLGFAQLHPTVSVIYLPCREMIGEGPFVAAERKHKAPCSCTVVSHPFHHDVSFVSLLPLFPLCTWPQCAMIRSIFIPPEYSI